MGLILPQIVRVRTNSSNYKYYREKGYEFEKCGDFIEVNVLNLHPGSTVKVKCICDICGKEREMWYRTVVKCNEENELITCASNSCKNKKRKDTNLKRYGCTCSLQSEEAKKKIKETNLERYSCESAIQNKEIQNKMKETNLKKYGCICSLQSEEAKKKTKETCIKKYGVDHPMQNTAIRTKAKVTNIERYGVENVAQSEIIQNRMKATCKERYGVEYAIQNKEIQDRIKATCKERYGVEYVMQNEEIKNKIKETILERYGCEYAMQNKEIQNKSKEAYMKKYGVDNPNKAKEIKDKKKATCKEKYGVEYAIQNKEIQDRIKATCKERYGVEYAIQNKEIQDRIKATCKERYGTENPMQNEEIKNKALDSFCFNGTGPCSRQQKYIHFLIGGVLNKRVCNSLVDICFKEEKMAIEYDGSGHFLTDIFNGNKIPTKEALLKEKNREDSIVNKGYKVIRFIATKDRIPSDEVILNLIEEFKNSDFKVIRINFEEGTIDRDYEEKWYCNFGELRKITKEDLEQFKK